MLSSELHEDFPTCVTFIWFLSSMAFLMGQKLWVHPEAFLTLLTYTGIFTCMASYMIIKFWAMKKLF